MQPIYYVVCEWVPNPNGWGIYRILETVECTLQDIQENRVNSKKWYGAEHPNLQTYMFQREPPNPFRDDVTEQLRGTVAELTDEVEGLVANIDY